MIEAMKQALEATEVLKSLFRQAEARHAGLFPSPNVVCQITVEDLRKGLYAADALRTAIAEAEKQELDKANENENNIKSAYQRGYLDGIGRNCPNCSDYKAMYIKVRDELAAKQQLTERQPAAQRQWVGLTEAEVDRCWNMTPMDTRNSRHMFAYAIEAKLKEKNT